MSTKEDFPIGTEVELIEDGSPNLSKPLRVRGKVIGYNNNNCLGEDWLMIDWGCEVVINSSCGWPPEEIQKFSYVQVLEPRNNDGRSNCFWCKNLTEKRGGGMYDVCPQCGR